jgi:hypothetical protein
MDRKAVGGDEGTSDPWVSTVGTMSAFLAGFSLASVVVITDGHEHFRWPGAAVLVLTIASVMLLVAVQEARRAARFYGKSSGKWRRGIWLMYHLGIIALLAGLGAALPPLKGVGIQEFLRWFAAWLAFAAAFVEAFLAYRAARRSGREPSGDMAGTRQSRELGL